MLQDVVAAARSATATDRLRAIGDRVRADPVGVRRGLEGLVETVPPDGRSRAEVALALAVACHENQDPVAALAALTEASVASTDEVHQLAVDLLKVKVLVVFGDTAGAIRVGGAALVRARALGDANAEGMLLVNLGFVHAQREEPEEYAAYSQQALDHFRRIGHAKGIAQALCNLGGALTALGRLHEARACYDEAFPLVLSLRWVRGEALVQAGLGGVECAQGAIDAGLRRYAASRVLLADLGDAFQIAHHGRLIGEYLLGAGRPAEALPPLDEAAGIATEQGFLGLAARVHALRSRAFEALGQLGPALEALRAHVASVEGDAHRRSEERVRLVEIEHRVQAARREADAERRRSEELSRANEALRSALLRQQELQDELRRLAETDGLTGLANRRKLREFAEQELGRGLRTGRSFVLVLLDVDHFKSVNDQHGHTVGDEVLVELAGRLVHAIRCVDVAGRWGGEEFGVLLVDTEQSGAAVAAERIRAAMEGSPFITSQGPVRVTVSGGIALWSRERHAGNLDEVLSRADHALYAAKREGRNRIVIAD